MSFFYTLLFSVSCGIFAMTLPASSLETTAYINANIYDGTSFLPNHDAFMVQNGRFLKLATTAFIKEAAQLKTKIVDLEGALVMPGFIESHAHIIGLGKRRLMLDLKGLMPEHIAKLVQKQAQLQPENTWIEGRGWDQNLWPGQHFPHKSLLTGVKNPVYLVRVDGHAAFVNDAALNLAGLNSRTQDPDGGHIVRDAQGNPSGVLIDTAMELVTKYKTNPTKHELEHYLDLGMQEAVSRGITSLHDAGSREDILNLFIEYATEDKLLLRLYALIDGHDEALVEHYRRRGPLSIGDMLTIRGIKYFADGALGSNGALLLNDYVNQPGFKGLALIEREVLLQRTIDNIRAGFQVATHAIGDGANQMVLDVYQEALTKTKVNNARLRIEHAQLIDPADHHRFKEYGIIASMQPIHCTSDMPWIKKRIHPEMLPQRAYPWASLLKAGAILAFGSDAPVEDINPLLGIFAAVSRSGAQQAEVFLPEEKLTLKQALAGYFHNAAYAEFAEQQKGAIKEGYVADFVVFSDNILHPTKSIFLHAKPIKTVVGGKVVFLSNNSAQQAE